MPEFPSIAHVAVTVTDLDRSTQWYTTLFGSDPVLDEDEESGAFHHTVYALSGGQLFGLHTHTQPATETFDERHTGLDHVAFTCSGRNELQYYAPDAFQVSGGLLRITAEPRPQQGYAYSSGIITTKNIFAQQYGYFEMRAQLPAGQGLWPAFWLLHSGPAGGDEIDIMEMLGHDPNTIYVSNHWQDEANQLQGQTQPVTSADFSSGMHTFGLNWTPDKLAWYVDGVKQAESTDHVPAGPMFILANLAVGGTWPGYPDATTPFPAVMSIDYIRVYPAGCLPAGLVDATATPASDANQDTATQQP